MATPKTKISRNLLNVTIFDFTDHQISFWLHLETMTVTLNTIKCHLTSVDNISGVGFK